MGIFFQLVGVTPFMHWVMRFTCKLLGRLRARSLREDQAEPVRRCYYHFVGFKVMVLLQPLVASSPLWFDLVFYGGPDEYIVQDPSERDVQ